MDSISAQMESDQAWTKNRLDDLGESDCKKRKVVIWFLKIEKNIKVFCDLQILYIRAPYGKTSGPPSIFNTKSTGRGE